MNNYAEWSKGKLYEGHINRLRAISNGTANDHNSIRSLHLFTNHKKHNNTCSAQMVKKHKLSTSVSQPNKEDQSKSKLKRLKTENSGMKKKVEKMYFPAPLIPGQESQLIKAALNNKTMTMKDKQYMLENYLLSRRILSARTVLKTREDKKSFDIHKKISQQMSRSQKIAQAYSSQRQEKFRQFQKEMKQLIEIGSGKSIFRFKIKSILLIKGILSKQPKILYNMNVIIGKKRYEAHALTYETLFTKQIILHFKKNMISNTPNVKIFLSVMRSNLQQEIGCFQPQIASFEKQQERIYRVMKGKIPVGTVQIVGSVNYSIKTEVSLQQ